MAAGGGDDAEEAAIAASVLDFEVGTGLGGVGREGKRGQFGVREGIVVEDLRDDRGERNKSRPIRLPFELTVVPKSRRDVVGTVARDDWVVLSGEFERYFGNEGFVAVADDGVDFGESGEFLRGALGVTAGDDDASLGVLAANAAEPGAGLAIGFRGDATGVYDDNICRRKVLGRNKAAMAQIGGNGLAIGAAGAAPKVFDVIFCHVAQCINGGRLAWPRGRRESLLSSVCQAFSCTIQRWNPGVLMKRRILLVDDDVAILLTLKAVLEISGFEVTTAASAREAKQKLKSNEYHMVITDLRMESETAGEEVAAAAKKAANRPAVAMLTAYPPKDAEWVTTSDTDKVLVKPMNTQDLLRQIEAMLVAHEDKKRLEAGKKVEPVVAEAATKKSKARPAVAK
jgi:CheY-like chemotaxis protein